MQQRMMESNQREENRRMRREMRIQQQREQRVSSCDSNLIDRAMVIESVRLEEKSGGRSGHWVREGG
jgi:hypothetical protein